MATVVEKKAELTKDFIKQYLTTNEEAKAWAKEWLTNNKTFVDKNGATRTTTFAQFRHAFGMKYFSYLYTDEKNGNWFDDFLAL